MFSVVQNRKIGFSAIHNTTERFFSVKNKRTSPKINFKTFDPFMRGGWKKPQCIAYYTAPHIKL